MTTDSRAGAGRRAAAWRGALGFGAVSAAVYGTVAFGGRWLYRHLTEPGAYTFWAALYLLGAPWLLARLLVVPERRGRFMGMFVLGFLAYAVGWVAVYFPTRTLWGELLASVVGAMLFGWVLAAGFVRRSPGGAALGVLMVGHTAGYFAGNALNAWWGGPAGMVSWGVCHGLGFGAAIGWAVARWEPGRTTDVPGPAAGCAHEQ